MSRKLLQFLSENGFSAIEKLSGNSFYQWESISVDPFVLLARIDYLCEYFKKLADKVVKKRRPEKSVKEESKKKKFQVPRDIIGNVSYPITINNSLTIVSIGTIKPGPFYHSEHNLFPIGYKSIRTHASMFRKGEKAEYVCEILDAGEKPYYRVTPSEDKDNPITKDSSTGCWSVICKRVNDLQDVKKPKVTISGTERFGLIEANVVKLLESLPNAEKNERYNFKFK